MTVRFEPVSTLVMVTVTFGNTPPVVSLTTPRIAPVGSCATAGITSKISSAMETTLRHTSLRYGPMTPPPAKSLDRFAIKLHYCRTWLQQNSLLNAALHAQLP